MVSIITQSAVSPVGTDARIINLLAGKDSCPYCQPKKIVKAKAGKQVISPRIQFDWYQPLCLLENI
ncbi:MAG: hypothetical protein MJ201_01775 [Mycoplasmoidaceae bacterium]|nr:hypothetical protein [Mycoplasmoidaceae bacterium]